MNLYESIVDSTFDVWLPTSTSLIYVLFSNDRLLTGLETIWSLSRVSFPSFIHMNA